jgi:predicted peptidase
VIFPQIPPERSSSAMETYAANESARLSWVNNPQTKIAMELIRDMVLNGRADPDRIYIGGLSMGGIITYAMLSAYPDWFAAAVPICGRTSIESLATWAKKVPAWLFVGDQDLPFIEPNREMNKTLTKLKAAHKYTEYPGVGHNSWDPAFVEPELFPWVYSKVKKNNLKSFK